MIQERNYNPVAGEVGSGYTGGRIGRIVGCCRGVVAGCWRSIAGYGARCCGRDACSTSECDSCAASHTMIALAGNPNTGKSTIFNALTGSNQHVGNWPGKTVEKKEGLLKHDGHEITVVDLPGTYSLSACSLEEQISRDFIIKSRPRVVVNVLDSTNLERNLYLTAQLMEIGVPVIIVLNMCDIAAARNITIDTERLAHRLNNAPIISVDASRERGLTELKQTIAAFAVRQPLTIYPAELAA